jgi:hypothetical protein
MMGFLHTFVVCVGYHLAPDDNHIRRVPTGPGLASLSGPQGRAEAPALKGGLLMLEGPRPG